MFILQQAQAERVAALEAEEEAARALRRGTSEARRARLTAQNLEKTRERSRKSREKLQEQAEQQRKEQAKQQRKELIHQKRLAQAAERERARRAKLIRSAPEAPHVARQRVEAELASARGAAFSFGSPGAQPLQLLPESGEPAFAATAVTEPQQGARAVQTRIRKEKARPTRGAITLPGSTVQYFPVLDDDKVARRRIQGGYAALAGSAGVLSLY